MKIIDIAICIDNIDPKGMGRVRCVRYNDYVGEKEKALNYKEWISGDPFLCSPFLPNNINVIPEIGQAVKIINYNTDKETVNQEYIAGPFTTMYDFNSQSFSQQIENTTYGVAIKKKEDIVNEQDELKNDKSKGAFAKKRDHAIYGKYGSDILFTENGLQLRGGKLLSKDAASSETRKLMIDTPVMADKSARLYLKKFPHQAKLEDTTRSKQKLQSRKLKSVIEYEVDNLTTPTKVSFFVYKVNQSSTGSTFNTNIFNANTELELDKVQLINTGETISTPTFIIPATTIQQCYLSIRTSLLTLHEDNLSEFDINYDSEDLHPFYFRPTQKFRELQGTDVELKNKLNILNKVKIYNVGPSFGMIWSKKDIQIKPEIENVQEKVLKIIPDSPEQTFSTFMSDKIYLLSTDANKAKIDDRYIIFEELDKYEITQKDYLEKIDSEKNTYSMVRGDILIQILDAIIDVLRNHQHNVVGPYLKGIDDYDKRLFELMQSYKNDILNTSIKIN